MCVFQRLHAHYGIGYVLCRGVFHMCTAAHVAMKQTADNKMCDRIGAKNAVGSRQ